jgi:hypothetical protein
VKGYFAIRPCNSQNLNDEHQEESSDEEDEEQDGGIEDAGDEATCINDEQATCEEEDE